MSETLLEQHPDLSEVEGNPSVQKPPAITGELCPTCGRNEVIDVAGVGHICNLCGHILEAGEAKDAAKALAGAGDGRTSRTTRKTSSTRKTGGSRRRRKTGSARKTTAARSVGLAARKTSNAKRGGA